MPAIARSIALLLAAAMFAFSTWIFMQTGDWVAVIFALGSVGYAVYFFSTAPPGK
jgi:hypothetical protein